MIPNLAGARVTAAKLANINLRKATLRVPIPTRQT